MKAAIKATTLPGPKSTKIYVPFYGYLAFVGLFNVYATLFVSVLANIASDMKRMA